VFSSASGESQTSGASLTTSLTTSLQSPLTLPTTATATSTVSGATQVRHDCLTSLVFMSSLVHACSVSDLHAVVQGSLSTLCAQDRSRRCCTLLLVCSGAVLTSVCRQVPAAATHVYVMLRTLRNDKNDNDLLCHSYRPCGTKHTSTRVQLPQTTASVCILTAHSLSVFIQSRWLSNLCQAAALLLALS
jgi:hypothetical protein